MSSPADWGDHLRLDHRAGAALPRARRRPLRRHRRVRAGVVLEEGAAEELLKYCMAGGKILKGLQNRRIDERAMFLS